MACRADIILPRRMLSLHGLCVYLKLRSSSFVKDQRVENAQFMSSVIPVTCPQTEGLYDATKLMKKMDKKDHSNPFFFNRDDRIARFWAFKDRNLSVGVLMKRNGYGLSIILLGMILMKYKKSRRK